MKQRIKNTINLITTREEAELAMNDLALIIANQRKLLIQRDAQVLAINERLAPNLATYDQAIQEKTAALQAWAEANSSTFPGGLKSITFTSGKLGFRTGTPKLTLLSRAFNWDKVLGLLRGPLPGFIRTKQEVDKDSILAAHAAKKIESDKLSAVGLKVVQDETFYIEPDLTQFEPRQTAAA